MENMPDYVPNPEPGTRRKAKWYYRMWEFLEEPRSITVVQIIFTYWAALFFGTFTLFDPPRTTSFILGSGLVTFICVLMIISGIIGTVTAAFGWRWIERTLALGFLAIAWAGYVYSVGEAQFFSDGSRWLQLGFLSTSLSGMATRFLRIRTGKYGPGLAP